MNKSERWECDRMAHSLGFSRGTLEIQGWNLTLFYQSHAGILEVFHTDTYHKLVDIKLIDATDLKTCVDILILQGENCLNPVLSV